MDLGIIGFTTSGKSTIFSALTGAQTEAAAVRRSGLEHNLAVIKVPDPRLDRLNELVHPKKTTPAEVRYLDFGGFAGDFGRTSGLAGQLLNALGTVDAFIHVVRAFEDPSLPHPLGSVDAARDIETMNMEMAFSDAGIVERRLERLTNSLKSVRATEREAHQREFDLLKELHAQIGRAHV